jgi:hypothetical protein
MHRRFTICASMAVAAVVAAPAAPAIAAGTVVGGPVKLKGYSMSVVASDAATGDRFSVSAVRTSGKSQQSHSWSFPGVAVSIQGAKATIKGSLGRYGAVDLKAKTGAATKGLVPKGCTGKAGKTRRGTLSGKLKAVLDATFFKTFAPKKMPAAISTASTLKCTGQGNPTFKGLLLTSSLAGPAAGGGSLQLTIARVGNRVQQTMFRTEDATVTAPANVFHVISATTGAAGLTAAADLSSATAAAASPFLSGSLSFAGAPSATTSSGKITGDFTGRFDSIGAQSLPSGTSALLLKR